MILVYNFYEWIDFFETLELYEVSGKVMTCPCPITGDPIVHDIILDHILDLETSNDMFHVVDHDSIADKLNYFIL